MENRSQMKEFVLNRYPQVHLAPAEARELCSALEGSLKATCLALSGDHRSLLRYPVLQSYAGCAPNFEYNAEPVRKALSRDFCIDGAA
jgi:hypothetical protein